MFEKIILRRSDKGPALSIGELCEALLFYQNVHIVLDSGSLSHLVSKIGMPALLSLLKRPNISAIYCEDMLATKTDTIGNISTHEFVAMTMMGNKETGTLRTKNMRLEDLLIRQGYQTKQSKRLIERFRLMVPIRIHSDDHFIDGGIVNAAKQDLLDDGFIHESMRLVLKNTVGNSHIRPDFRFKAYPNDSYFIIDTNIDFDACNRIIKNRDINADEITPAYLINNILMARADTILASRYGGEFYTSELTSEIIRLKYSELLVRIGIEKEELSQFTDIVIADFPSLREVINSGERSFDEFLVLLDKSNKFREWIKGINPDGKMVKEYWDEVASEGWLNILPSKVIRYVVGTAAGTFGDITGVSVSVADSFLLEKIFGGWRPSHFVDGKLKPFIDNEDG